jgi:putative ABC transport system substrate-binding protein
MKRRDFSALIATAATAWPTASWAQSGKVTRIGILVLGSPDPAPFLKEIREGLRALGYIEGKNLVFEFRSAKGAMAELKPLARELVALKVDVIVGFQTPAVTAAKEATTETPIVMLAGDPVGTGLVASLARPGGNITGMAGAGAELGAKMLELIREVLPSKRRVSVLANAPDPFHKPFVQHIESAGRSLGLTIQTILLQGPDELESAFAQSTRDGAEAVVVQPSLPHQRSTRLALRHLLPAFSPNLNFAILGGLVSYSADQPAMYRESAIFVDKILKGRKPADLPVQLPTKYLLAVNLKTATALGLVLPPTLLARADRVIE